ncbi:MAG: hypothetical protein AAF565_10625, partial [Pseudomonadota bacterium]
IGHDFVAADAEIAEPGGVEALQEFDRALSLPRLRNPLTEPGDPGHRFVSYTTRQHLDAKRPRMEGPGPP